MKKQGLLEFVAWGMGIVWMATACLADTDLAISKTVSDPMPAPLDVITYTITASNAGPEAVTSATVTDLLPSGTEYITHDNGAYTPSNGLWNIGSLDVGAVSSLTIQAKVQLPAALAATIHNPTPVATDFFGCAVAMLGEDLLAVGAYRDDAGAEDAGSVYLYDLQGTLLTTITNPSPGVYDVFGYSLASLGTDRLIVGALYDDVGTTEAGCAYLYDTNGTRLATLENPTPAYQDRFSYSVAGLGTDKIIVGAYTDDAGATDSGSVYVFDTNGVLLTTITNPAPATNDSFGVCVAGLGTDKVLAGAHWDNTGAADAGCAYLFDADGTLLVTITNPVPDASDYFGEAVGSLGDDRILVGAPRDDAGATDSGIAYLFDTNGSLLATFFNPQPGNANGFGFPVLGMGPDTVVIGALRNDIGATDSGSAYVFDTNGVLLCAIDNPEPNQGDEFANKIAATDNRILVGTHKDDAGGSNAGSAYLFDIGLGGRVIRNSASLTASLPNDTDPSNNTGTVELVTGSRSDLQVTKTGLSTTLPGGGVNTYTITVSNRGPDTATGIQTTEFWPPELIPLSATPQTGTYDTNYNTWHIDQLAPGEETTLSVQAQVVDEVWKKALTITNAEADNFGFSVLCVDTDKILVGADIYSGTATNEGRVFLYNASGELLSTIANPDPEEGDRFGIFLARFGTNQFLVGTQGYHGKGAGAYLFDVDGSLLLTITNPTTQESNGFGNAVAEVGDRHIAVGAMRDDTGAQRAGAVYIFDTNAVLLTTITNPSPASGDSFGFSLSRLGSNRLMICAGGEDMTGCLYIYSEDGTMLQRIPSPRAGFEIFGHSTADLGCGRIGIGIRHMSLPHQAYIYDTNGVLLVTLTNPVTTEPTSFGFNVAATREGFLVVGSSMGAFIYNGDGQLLQYHPLMLNNAPMVYSSGWVSGWGPNGYVAGDRIAREAYLFSADWTDTGTTNRVTISCAQADTNQADNAAEAGLQIEGLPRFRVLGTNGFTIAHNEPAGLLKGTLWNTTTVGESQSRILAITNSGTEAITITEWSTNGLAADHFRLSDLPVHINAGAVSNFTVTFEPPVAGTHDAAIAIACESCTSYRVNLQGEGIPPPVVDITNENTIVYWPDHLITIGGTNNTSVIGQMGWSNAFNGSNGMLAASSSWQIPGVPLSVGENLIHVWGTNDQGMVAGDSVTFTLRAIPHTGASPIHYVSLDGGNEWPFTTWETAARTIQDAVDTAMAGDKVLVSNGTYNTGGRVAAGSLLTNRLVITNAITVESLNGRDVAIIEGYGPAGPMGNAAVRCVYMGGEPGSSKLAGFTLRNGYTMTFGHDFYDQSGGGALGNCSWDSDLNILSNCTISFCYASSNGGGVAGCSLVSCTVQNCDASGYGGGTAGCRLMNCIVTSNSAYIGGGISDTPFDGGWIIHGADRCEISGNNANDGGGVFGTAGIKNSFIHNNDASGFPGETACGGVMAAQIDHCTIVNNQVLGTKNCQVNNSIVYYNFWNHENVSYNSSCTTPEPPGVGNITNNPLLEDPLFDSARLQWNSPCIDSGLNDPTMPLDLYGVARPQDGDNDGTATSDMGAHEYVITNFPHVDITNQNETVVYPAESISIGGTNNEHVVGQMGWSNQLNGAQGSLPAILNWNIPDIPLAVGTNLITVWGTNAQGQAASDTVDITLLPVVHHDDSPIHYVSLNGGNEWPFTTWETAARTIQDAVDTAMAGDKVLVSNGTYNTGGRVAEGSLLTNRVVITNAITVESLNGRDHTSIHGVWTLGDAAVRCVYMGGESASNKLVGFTLTYGGTMIGGHEIYDRSGGGALGDPMYPPDLNILSNCLIQGCFADAHAGGVAGCLLVECTVQQCNAGGYGGGTAGCTLTNCFITANSAVAGGGISAILIYGAGGGWSWSTNNADRCDIANNQAGVAGGVFLPGGEIRNSFIHHNSLSLVENQCAGVEGADIFHCTIVYNLGGSGTMNCQVHNSIVYHNTTNWMPSDSYSFSCTTPEKIGSSNCIINNPMFEDPFYDSARLLWNSPCIDSGQNDPTMPLDLYGVVRPQDGDNNGTAISDMGASEYVITNFPYVDITNQNETVIFPADTISIGGTNNEHVVGQMGWSNQLNGAQGSLPATQVWNIPDIPLTAGINLITVWGTNDQGMAASDTVDITLPGTHHGNSPIHYVAINGFNIWPYTNWTMAARTIQDAVDTAMAGDTVLVSNGTYNTGGRVAVGSLLTNRVVITNSITVESLVGPVETTIQGAGPLGNAAVRCVYLGGESASNKLVGFTLMEGHTMSSGHDFYDMSGGGVLGDLMYAPDLINTLSNCYIFNCYAASNGGGVAGCLLVTCTVQNCNAGGYGGGTAGCTLTNCFITFNSAIKGGGVSIIPIFQAGGWGWPLYNVDRCEISDNQAEDAGGVLGWAEIKNSFIHNNGAWLESGYECAGVMEADVYHCTIVNNQIGLGTKNCQVSNSIVYYNAVNNWMDDGYSYSYSCTTPEKPGSSNCITNEPFPEDLWLPSAQLPSDSPCIDSGLNDPTMPLDLYGVARPLDGDDNGTAICDMGASEYVNCDADTDGDGMDDCFEVNNGFDPTDPSDGSGDADDDGFSNRDEAVAGTDPHNRNSSLVISSPNPSDPSTLIFDCVAGRLYSVDYTTNLVTGPWINVPGLTNLACTSSPLQVPITNETDNVTYRLHVWRP